MDKPALIFNIQVLRFVAATSVMTKHALETFFPPAIALMEIPWNGGVDLFFVISGFIMAWLTRGQFGTKGAARRFLLARLIRIVPPYWAFTSMMILLLAVAPNMVRSTRLGLDEALTSFLFIPWRRPIDQAVVPLLSQGWTLNYEMFFYACFAGTLLFRRGKWFLVGGFLFLAALGLAVRPTTTIAWFYTRPLILEFAAGIAIEEIRYRGLKLRPLAIAACIAGAIAVFLVTQSSPLAPERLVSRGLPAILLASAFILAPEPGPAGRLGRSLRLGGDASYTIYLSHPFTIKAVALLLSIAGLVLPVVGTVIAMVLATGIAVLIYTLAERPLTERLYLRAGLKRPQEAQLVAP